MIAFACTGCGAELRVKGERTGKPMRCPRCGQPLRVPGTSAQSSATPSPAEVQQVAAVGDEPATMPPAPRSGPTAMDPSAPPGYEILGELGRGGMGVVYKARHVGLNRLVALKMILAGAHAGPDDLARFRTEAEALARIQHPNIVQIYDIGEQNGCPYLSLEFVDGGSLAEKLKGKPKDARAAAHFVQALARAVHAAHRQGIIHRDLKPANVLLTAQGVPKVTDFGLAKRLNSTSGRTQTGQIMGTPSYMAPEQAGGSPKDVGPATDVYALGTILYELLAGRPPFQAQTPVETILQVISEEPVPPSELNSKVPRALEAVCLRCLEKDPRRRYTSAQALAEDLRRVLSGEPIPSRRMAAGKTIVKWVRDRPAMTLALGTACALLLGLSIRMGFGWTWLPIALSTLALFISGRILPLTVASLTAVIFLYPLFSLLSRWGTVPLSPTGRLTPAGLAVDSVGCALFIGCLIGFIGQKRSRLAVVYVPPLILLLTLLCCSVSQSLFPLLGGVSVGLFVGVVARSVSCLLKRDCIATVTGALYGFLLGAFAMTVFVFPGFRFITNWHIAEFVGGLLVATVLGAVTSALGTGRHVVSSRTSHTR
jgi:hypothetical protein